MLIGRVREMRRQLLCDQKDTANKERRDNFGLRIQVSFVFPSRRRHTRLQGDWSSDVCSSDLSMASLEAAGYEVYEISNVARPGRRSRHNLKYWTDGEWLGFGPGAHSTRTGARWRNVSSTDDYIQRIGTGSTVVAECRTLSRDERLGDALFTGLRLTDGIDIDTLSEHYGTDIWKQF